MSDDRKNDRMDKLTFRAHVQKYLLIQFAFIAIALLIYHSDILSFHKMGNIALLMIMALASTLITTKCFDYYKYRARLKDAHPDFELNMGAYLVIWVFPLAYVALTIYLCIQDSGEAKKVPKLFKLQYAIPAFMALLVLQSAPQLSYWVANPTYFYILQIGTQAAELIEYKDKAIYGKDVLEGYQKIRPGKLNSTQIALLTVVNTVVIHRENSRAVASDESKSDRGFKLSLEIVDWCHRMIRTGEDTKLGVLDYGPLQWIHPSGLVEISLLTALDRTIQLKFNEGLLEKSFSILTKLEEGLQKSNPSQKDEKLKQIQKMREDLMATKTFLVKS